MNKEQILEAIGSMSVLELNDLVKAIEKKFNVTAAAPVAVVGDSASDAEAVEQSEFEVILIASGERKINVIKVVREITNLGLKEAKELVDNCPKPLFSDRKLSKEEAETARMKLETAGATVEIK